MTESRLNFPVLRTPPSDVVRLLREVDPTAELVYFGRGRWILGAIVRRSDLRGQCERIVDSALETLKKTEWRYLHRFDYRTTARLQFALLGLQGFRPIAEYVFQGPPDSRVVDDFRRRDWLYRNMRDVDYHTAADAAIAKPRLEAHADLVDPARARDSHHYLTTINVCPSVSLGPKDHTRSGFTRIRSI